MVDSKEDKEVQFKIVKRCMDQCLKYIKPLSGILRQTKQTLESLYEDLTQSTENAKKQQNELESTLNQEREKRHQLNKIISKLKKRKTNPLEQTIEFEAMRLKLEKANKAIKRLKYKDTLFIQLISNLKQKGVPIDEIYNKEIRSRYSSQNTSLRESTSEVDQQSAPITYETRAEGSNSTVNITPAKQQGPLVGKLQIPMLQIGQTSDKGFHQEFVERIDEFSKSWRDQLEREEGRFESGN